MCVCVCVCVFYRMEGQSRSSHKHLLLQVWCGLLTVAMVVMAALLISIKPKSTEVSTSVTRREKYLYIHIHCSGGCYLTVCIRVTLEWLSDWIVMQPEQFWTAVLDCIVHVWHLKLILYKSREWTACVFRFECQHMWTHMCLWNPTCVISGCHIKTTNCKRILKLHCMYKKKSCF